MIRVAEGHGSRRRSSYRSPKRGQNGNRHKTRGNDQRNNRGRSSGKERKKKEKKKKRIDPEDRMRRTPILGGAVAGFFGNRKRRRGRPGNIATLPQPPLSHTRDNPRQKDRLRREDLREPGKWISKKSVVPREGGFKISGHKEQRRRELSPDKETRKEPPPVQVVKHNRFSGDSISHIKSGYSNTVLGFHDNAIRPKEQPQLKEPP
ncbi:hypothetical protein FPQ18DRAFT_310128 [Pyronema domesticum]|nr:hypothetical protein FPQ18DRAFT_310128 [Pyronema domesticum]